MAAPAPVAGVPVVVSSGSGVPVGKTTSTSRTVTDTVTGESVSSYRVARNALGLYATSECVFIVAACQGWSQTPVARQALFLRVELLPAHVLSALRSA